MEQIKTQPDVNVEADEGLYLLRPETEAGAAWMNEYLPEDAPMWGPAVVCEHRFVQDIVEGMLQDGLKVSLGYRMIELAQ